MKIVVTGTRGIPGIMGGVETHCENLFPRIAAFGEDVTVICRTSYVKDASSEWTGVHLVNVSTPRFKSLEAIVHTFRAINWAASHHADIIHINAVGPALLVPYAKIRGMKVIFTHHGPDYDRDKWGVMAKMMLKFGERLGCKYADHVIVISNVILNIVQTKYRRKDNVHLIPNGVPAPEFCNFPEYFEELDIQNDRYVLVMSRFVPEKRLEDAISAFTNTDLSSKGYKLVIAGDTDFEDEYSRNLKKYAIKNNVVLTGFVRGMKLHSLLTNASLYILPSSHEGLPIALLEAMSYGIPVIASDIPANLEVKLPSRNYFHLGNTDQLADKIKEIISDKRVQYEMSRYDWDRIAMDTETIYMSCETN